MEIRPGEVVYQRTETEGIFHRFELVVSEIHVEMLRKKISQMTVWLEDMPQKKERPDEEALEFWNMLNVSSAKEMLEARLEAAQEILEQCR